MSDKVSTDKQDQDNDKIGVWSHIPATMPLTEGMPHQNFGAGIMQRKEVNKSDYLSKREVEQ